MNVTMKKERPSAVKLKMISYAKKLFFTFEEVDPTKRKYTFSDIAFSVNKKFNKDVSKSLIDKWASDYGWKDRLKEYQVAIVDGKESANYEDKFEKNLSGFLEITSLLQEKVESILKTSKASPKVVFDTYARLITSHTEVLKTKYEMELKKAEIEEQKNKSAGFDALIEKIAEDTTNKVLKKMGFEEKQEESINDAEYEIIESEENKNTENENT